MSLFAAQTGLGSIKPKVWVEGDHLYARTSYPLQALTLFSYARKLHVDRQQRTIELQTVKFWFINQRRVIPFDQVAYIDSRYSDLGTSWGWTDTGFGRTDKWEKYTVSLALEETQERVKLFSFTGDGKVMTGTLGVLYGGDGLVDTYGDQEDHFKFFLSHLTEFLQVPVGGSDYIPVKDQQGLEYQCSVCRRTSIPGRDKCWMCGGPVEPVMSTETSSPDREADGRVDDSVEGEGDSAAEADAWVARKMREESDAQV